MNSEIAEISRPHKYGFADVELAPSQGALWRDGARVPVMPKPIAVLTVLVESAGQIVSKEELLERVWNLFKGRLPIVDQQERENTRIMPTAIKRKS